MEITSGIENKANTVCHFVQQNTVEYVSGEHAGDVFIYPYSIDMSTFAESIST